MSGLDGVQHGGIVHFVGAGLDHNDLALGTGNGQLQVALLTLGSGGVDNQLAVHQTHEHAADGAVPGDIGNGQSDGGTDHTGDLGAAVGIDAHDSHNDGHIVAHVLGEQGTDGTVDHTAGQDSLLTGAALTAHKAAGDAADGVQLLFKINAQGEEINAFTGLFGHGDVAQHGGLAIADQTAAVGQGAHLAGLDNQLAAAQLGLKGAEFCKGLFAGSKFCSHVFASLKYFCLLFARGRF